METELTKKIKIACRYYKPAMNSNLRTIRYANEVWTPTGIVDCIRFEDYVQQDKSSCKLIDFDKFGSSEKTFLTNVTNGQVGRCKIEGEAYPNKNCHGCVFHHHSHELGMLTTCYEVKISISDFKSPNGHNFHGNKNYYVIPTDIYDDIKDLVPEDIGIIVYNKKTEKLRMKKECEMKFIGDELRVYLLYNAIKKWCDGNQN